MMWDGDCGAIPVVATDRRVVGILTDRDICIAAATRAAAPPNIQVKDVMSREVASCTADDDVKTAMRVMKDRRIRRIPVLDSQGRLCRDPVDQRSRDAGRLPVGSGNTRRTLSRDAQGDLRAYAPARDRLTGLGERELRSDETTRIRSRVHAVCACVVSRHS